MWLELGYVAASYLIGAIPTSYLVGRWFGGIDLRRQGSNNLGATNLYRVMGWRYAVPVALFDIAKGTVPVLLFGPLGSDVPMFPTLCGVMAVIGHVFSIFVGFKGGKGVATAAGLILGLAPWALLTVAAIWGLVVWATGYVSLGSVTAAALFPLADYLLHPARRAPTTVLIDLAIAAFIVWKHRANIQRLLNGTENRFGRRKTAAGQ